MLEILETVPEAAMRVSRELAGCPSGGAEPQAPRTPQHVGEARGNRSRRRLPDDLSHQRARRTRGAEEREPGQARPAAKSPPDRDPPQGDGRHRRDLAANEGLLDDVADQPRTRDHEAG